MIELLFGSTPMIHCIYEQYKEDGTELTLQSDLIKILHKEARNCGQSSGLSEGSIEKDGDSSSQGKRSRGTNISVKIPKRNIQKMPGFMERIGIWGEEKVEWVRIGVIGETIEKRKRKKEQSAINNKGG